MKKLVFITVLPLLTWSKANSQSEKHPVEQLGNSTQEPTAPLPGRSQKREVSAFASIEVTDGIKLYLRRGNQESVAVDASSQNLREKIKTVVVDNVLKVYFDASQDPNWKGLVGSSEEFKVYVTAGDLRALGAAKGAEVTLKDPFSSTGEVAIVLNSGASLNGKLALSTLSLKMRGGSSASVGGSVALLDVRVTGGSDFLSPYLQTEQCTAYASGDSKIQLFVNKSLEAESVNEAVIRYGGAAELKKKSTEQGGKILHI